MQFNITFKTIFEYVLKKLVLCIQIRFVSTEKTTRIASRASCLKLLLVVANLCNLRFFCEYTCEHGYDLCFNPILLKIDIHVRFMMMHVTSKRIVFFSNLLLVVKNLCNLRHCANKFVCTVLTDQQTRFC